VVGCLNTNAVHCRTTIPFLFLTRLSRTLGTMLKMLLDVKRKGGRNRGFRREGEEERGEGGAERTWLQMLRLFLAHSYRLL